MEKVKERIDGFARDPFTSFMDAALWVLGFTVGAWIFLEVLTFSGNTILPYFQ
jgi:hypothetical protein